MNLTTLKIETILAINPRSLTRYQIGWLTQDQIGGLTRYQIGGLTRYQIGGLTEENQTALFGDASVPKVDKLYSRILDDIEHKKRKLDQSTFGPNCNPETNLCKTPMCIAGHTVNLAGDAGYALKDRFSFEIAAHLIHRASCPDFPEPRYDSYPNEWALSYIREIAAIEGKQP